MKNKIFGDEVKTLPLARFKANPWNPNEMEPFMIESIRSDMRENGWVASEALFVWGKDETGATRNLIIDGEHRWNIARELGYEKGPISIVNGIDERTAKELTIKLNNKRGKWNTDAYRALVTEIQAAQPLNLPPAYDLGLVLGIPNLPTFLEPPPSNAGSGLARGKTKTVSLTFETEEMHQEFQDLVRTIGATTVTNTVMIALRALAAKKGRKRG